MCAGQQALHTSSWRTSLCPLLLTQTANLPLRLAVGGGRERSLHQLLACQLAGPAGRQPVERPLSAQCGAHPPTSCHQPKQQICYLDCGSGCREVLLPGACTAAQGGGRECSSHGGGLVGKNGFLGGEGQRWCHHYPLFTPPRHLPPPKILDTGLPGCEHVIWSHQCVCEELYRLHCAIWGLQH